MKKIKIYTRTGDQGQTSLFTGERVPKNDSFIDALGAVDECNSALGSAIAFVPNEEPFNELKRQLKLIQHALFDVGAAVATPRTKAINSKIEKTRFEDEAVHLLEKWMDQMEEKLPALHTFILPGGHPSAALMHLARSVCRKAERTLIPLHQKGDVADTVLIYLNRLSDYLFILARYLNALTNHPETLWEPHKTHQS